MALRKIPSISKPPVRQHKHIYLTNKRLTHISTVFFLSSDRPFSIYLHHFPILQKIHYVTNFVLAWDSTRFTIPFFFCLLQFFCQQRVTCKAALEVLNIEEILMLNIHFCPVSLKVNSHYKMFPKPLSHLKTRFYKPFPKQADTLKQP